VSYAMDDGSPESELCWFGDTAFGPHLLKILDGGDFSAVVRFGEPRVYPDRRAAADQTREEIVAMRALDAGVEEGKAVAV